MPEDTTLPTQEPATTEQVSTNKPDANKPDVNVEQQATSQEQQPAVDKLSALKKLRADRARDKELEELRSNMKTVAQERQELADLRKLKEQLADLPKHVKQLGLSPRELVRRLTEEYQDDIFNDGDSVPTTKKEDKKKSIDTDLQKDLEELKAFKKSEDEKRVTRERAEQLATEAQLAKRDDDFAHNLFKGNEDEFPTLNALGHDGTKLVQKVFYDWYNADPENARIRNTLLDDDMKVFALVAEEKAFNENKERFLKFSNLRKYQEILPKPDVQTTTPKTTTSKKKFIDEPIILEEAKWDDEDPIVEKMNKLAVNKK